MWTSLITSIVLGLINMLIKDNKKRAEMTEKYYNYLKEREKRVVKMETHKDRHDKLMDKVKTRLDEYKASLGANNEEN